MMRQISILAHILGVHVEIIMMRLTNAIKNSFLKVYVFQTILLSCCLMTLGEKLFLAQRVPVFTMVFGATCYWVTRIFAVSRSNTNCAYMSESWIRVFTKWHQLRVHVRIRILRFHEVTRIFQNKWRLILTKIKLNNEINRYSDS